MNYKNGLNFSFIPNLSILIYILKYAHKQVYFHYFYYDYYKL